MAALFRIVFFLGSALLIFFAVVELLVVLAALVGVLAPGVYSGVFGR